MKRLRAVYLAAFAVVLSLAAAGTACAASVNYGGQTTAHVTVFYFNLPANTQLFLRNEVDGGELMAVVPPVSGTGSAVVPFNILSPGPYQLTVLARQAGGWVAQSVMFYTFI
jgi:hypothetical protein